MENLDTMILYASMHKPKGNSLKQLVKQLDLDKENIQYLDFNTMPEEVIEFTSHR